MSTTESSAGSTHGHNILRWLAAAPMSAAALDARVDREIGSAAKFHTCDRADLSLSDLLALLAERGKIAETKGEWTSDLSKICGHDS